MNAISALTEYDIVDRVLTVNICFRCRCLFEIVKLNCLFSCKISECDSVGASVKYDEPWLPHAIPFKNDRPKKCLRFANESLVGRDDSTETCPVKYFDRTQTEKCSEFVFKTDEVNILNEFGIFCEENEYKLALIGTVNNLGRFIFMPITGILSDR